MTNPSPQTAGHVRTRPPDPRKLSRLSVSIIFLISGAAIGTWVSRIPAIQEHTGLSTGALGLALLGSTLGNLVVMPAAAWVSVRTGTRAVTIAGSLLVCLMLPLPALARSGWELAAALFALGLAVGAIEIGMNAQAVLVENACARPIMSSIHGMWSVGGMLGAAAGGLAASRGLAPLPHFALVAAFLTVLGLAVFGWLYRDTPEEREARVTEPAFGRPLRALAGLGLLCFCGMLAEGAIADWSAVYLKQVLGATPGLAAIGYSAFGMTMAAVRFGGDALNARIGPAAIARYGGVLAALGLALALAAGHPWVGIAGFGLVGVGLAIVVPLVYTAAGNTPGVAPGPAVASVATTGFTGFLVGPPLIGFAAEVVGLRLALALVVILCAGIVALANTVAPRREGG